LRIPEAILEGRTEGYPTDGRSIEGQFQRYSYPAPGHARVRMLYKYGGSHFGTTMQSGRLVDALRSPQLEFVINQSIWNEARRCTPTSSCRPARTSSAATSAKNGLRRLRPPQPQLLNHRVIVLQHRCIGRSAVEVGLPDLRARAALGLSAHWRGEERAAVVSRDLPELRPAARSLKRCCASGYYVVPERLTANRTRVAGAFADGHRKDARAEALPSEYGAGI
jgi:trimethylamine-N-oxide reductase (cytochrome c)